MRNLIRIIIKYHFFLLFLIFEAFALFLSIKHSNVKTQAFITSANTVSGFFNKQFSGISNYFSLNKTNKKLLQENEEMQNKLSKINSLIEKSSSEIKDSKFTYQMAEIIKNSISRTNNFLTIDKGYKDGIKQDMAVISSDGIIGITAKVSKYFTTVISILNSKLKISGKLNRTNYYGSVYWEAGDHRYVILSEIPNHVEVNIGDKVVTSGYSAIFPEGIPIGVVYKISDVKENNFLKIQVKLNPDFKNLRYIYIVENSKRDEQLELENETIEDFQF